MYNLQIECFEMTRAFKAFPLADFKFEQRNTALSLETKLNLIDWRFE